jgi:flavin reductase (DIM6/NTAB) family NADH-FMN oxidoreductase RutF
MVLWSLDRQSSRYHAFAQATHYAIHVLHEHQEQLCMEVARNPAVLHGASLEFNAEGVPVLDDCMARFDCEKAALYEGGDHMIILGRVNLVTTLDEYAPLAFFGGRTGTFTAQGKR